MTTTELRLQNRIDEIAKWATRVIGLAGTAIAFGAMAILALRSALRLAIRWDELAYHLPFAAMHARLNIPYEVTSSLFARYQGFPPLPEFLQGILWRMTGSINATGVINYLALVLFIYFAWRYLGAKFWVLVLLCLSAPLVLIHAASSYVDLFSNVFVAIGVTALLAIVLFEQWTNWTLLIWGLAGTATAAWCKYTMLPFVLALFIAYLVVCGRWMLGLKRSRFLGWVAAAMLIASLPYLKNFIVYRNPIWPVGVPALAKYMPHYGDNATMDMNNIPGTLRGSNRIVLFTHSLFEIGHPTSYPNRERWIIDQGSTGGSSYRSGGFWVVSVITASLSAILLGFLSKKRRGSAVIAAIVTMWFLVSICPQSHELRYFQFLPLSIAAIVAMFIPHVQAKYPLTICVISCLLLGEFIWVSKINHAYYRVERIGYKEMTAQFGASQIWAQLEPGHTYCAVKFDPFALLLTGPTMHEFRIIGRDEMAQCPLRVKVLMRPTQ